MAERLRVFILSVLVCKIHSQAIEVNTNLQYSQFSFPPGYSSYTQAPPSAQPVSPPAPVTSPSPVSVALPSPRPQYLPYPVPVPSQPCSATQPPAQPTPPPTLTLPPPTPISPPPTLTLPPPTLNFPPPTLTLPPPTLTLPPPTLTLPPPTISVPPPAPLPVPQPILQQPPTFTLTPPPPTFQVIPPPPIPILPPPIISPSPPIAIQELPVPINIPAVLPTVPNVIPSPVVPWPIPMIQTTVVDNSLANKLANILQLFLVSKTIGSNLNPYCNSPFFSDVTPFYDAIGTIGTLYSPVTDIVTAPFYTTSDIIVPSILGVEPNIGGVSEVISPFGNYFTYSNDLLVPTLAYNFPQIVEPGFEQIVYY